MFPSKLPSTIASVLPVILLYVLVNFHAYLALNFLTSELSFIPHHFFQASFHTFFHLNFLPYLHQYSQTSLLSFIFPYILPFVLSSEHNFFLSNFLPYSHPSFNTCLWYFALYFCMSFQTSFHMNFLVYFSFNFKFSLHNFTSCCTSIFNSECPF